MSTLSIPVTRKLRNIASVKRNIRVECVHWSLTKSITVRWRRLEHRACVCLTLSAHKRITAAKLAHAWVRPVMERHVAPPSELQWHTCTFRQRAAYRTAISAAQILVDVWNCLNDDIVKSPSISVFKKRLSGVVWSLFNCNWLTVCFKHVSGHMAFAF